MSLEHPYAHLCPKLPEMFRGSQSAASLPVKGKQTALKSDASQRMMYLKD